MSFIRFGRLRFIGDPFFALSRLVYQLGLGPLAVIDNDALHQLGFGFKNGVDITRLGARIDKRWAERSEEDDSSMYANILREALICWLSSHAAETGRVSQKKPDVSPVKERPPEKVGLTTQDNDWSEPEPRHLARRLVFSNTNAPATRPRMRHPNHAG